MDLANLTNILVNALLVVVIIAVYVHLVQLIKHDGMKIKVLQEQVKEGMSAAQRYGLAGMYVGKRPNLLMPTDKQTPGNAEDRFPLITNTRGNVNLSSMVPKKDLKDVKDSSKDSSKVSVTSGKASDVASNLGVSTGEAIKNGASSAAAVTGFKHANVNDGDESLTVNVKQTGMIESSESFTGTNGRVAPIGTFLYNSSGRPLIASTSA